MTEKRNLCAQIPLALFNRVGAERDKAGQTNSEFITNLLTEYFDWKENGGADMARENGKERTLAVQISEDLYQRIKAHLERMTARSGQKLTQKDFVIGLIEAALADAEQAEAERAEAERAEAEGIGSVEAAQGEDTERQNGVERQDEADTDSAPEEASQELPQDAPCEDGVTTENGEESQPTENG